MAKKMKRKVSQNLVEGTAVNGAATVASVSTRTSVTEFKPDYSYVIKDLKFIGALAVIFTSALVILSFFIK